MFMETSKFASSPDTSTWRTTFLKNSAMETTCRWYCSSRVLMKSSRVAGSTPAAAAFAAKRCRITCSPVFRRITLSSVVPVPLSAKLWACGFVRGKPSSTQPVLAALAISACTIGMTTLSSIRVPASIWSFNSFLCLSSLPTWMCLMLKACSRPWQCFERLIPGGPRTQTVKGGRARSKSCRNAIWLSGWLTVTCRNMCANKSYTSLASM
mmetsp:Transcript_52197/g.151963  ORF Transcript_52197/g.151963 Transcript_52197/m.151963 type:complete len:210 (+) Transcript_52197:843-1472(+)